MSQLERRAKAFFRKHISSRRYLGNAYCKKGCVCHGLPKSTIFGGGNSDTLKLDMVVFRNQSNGQILPLVIIVLAVGTESKGENVVPFASAL